MSIVLSDFRCNALKLIFRLRIKKPVLIALYALLLFIFPDDLQAQKAIFGRNWLEGSVVLKDGEVIHGEILPRTLALNFVCIKKDTVVLNLDPQKVSRFTFSKTEKQRERTYYSIDKISIGDFKPAGSPAFYEIIHESSEYAVLGWHMLETDVKRIYYATSMLNPMAVAQNAYYAETVDVDFEELIFVLKGNGEALPFLKVIETDLINSRKMLNKKIIRKMFPNHANEVFEFIKKEGLSLKKRRDMPAIFSYADGLME